MGAIRGMEASASWYRLDGTGGPSQAPAAVSVPSFFSPALEIMLIYFGAPSDAAITPIQNVYREDKQLKQLMRGRAGKPA